ncbi:MAG: cyclic nucleotide-binding domain-containing protein [Elusimicrobia bacterium]|nr:cyclic nucleotide-binding domain-containing protein [Elusimicrobiota bacterium]
MEALNFAFFGEDKKLLKEISGLLGSYDINIYEISDLDELKGLTENRNLDLIFVSSDREKTAQTDAFDSARQTTDGIKIPVFIFTKTAEEYHSDGQFRQNFLKTVKKAAKVKILPLRRSRKSVQFGENYAEKRKFPRISIKIPVEILKMDNSGKIADAILRNVSAGGISVNTLSKISESEAVLKFALGEGYEFSIVSEKIRDEEKEEHFHIAFRFKEISKENLRKLNEFTDTFTVLKFMRIFEDFDDDEIRLLAGAVKKIQIFQGGIIFSEGATGRSLYIVKDGKVKIFKTTGKPPAEKETVLAVIRNGDFFGEMALLTAIKRTASAQAVSDTILYKIEREDFEKKIISHEDISLKLYRNFVFALIDRLRKTDQELIDSPFRDPVFKSKNIRF